jgi:hypothetical protein
MLQATQGLNSFKTTLMRPSSRLLHSSGGITFKLENLKNYFDLPG